MISHRAADIVRESGRVGLMEVKTTSRQKVKRLLITTAVGRWLLLPYRWKISAYYTFRPLLRAFSWLFTSREITNFTYDLTERNKAYLAAYVSAVTGITHDTALGYIHELEQDETLRDHICRLTERHPEQYVADLRIQYCRRVGWYAFTRALKPKVVVETGVDKGLGSVVLSAALMRNCAEGYEGHHYGLDINPEAGYLLKEPYTRYGEIIYGDSIQTLEQFQQSIDLFINDSDHSTDYEMREYEAIAKKLGPKAVILGDNAHETDKLLRFALKTGRRFLFFREAPKNHWYPGGGIGVAYQEA
jgi:predicted O-methyltransferase YrrM